MIRRITKNNDLKDIIRSIPSDVINNINEVRYYVYGYEDKFIAPEFTQEGDILKVIIPAEDLETLPDGLLYRQCFYTKNDVDYPDGVYNLSITDNLELWIYSKENSVQPPIGSNYLQEDDLKTINGESLVGKGDIVIQTTAENIECGPVSSGLFNFSNVNEGLIQITDSVEEINNNKENKKNIYYINVDYSTKQVTNTLQEIENIRQQLYSTNVYQNNLVYVMCNGSFCPVTSIQVTPLWMYITATFLIPRQVCYNICIIYEDGFINTYFNNIANKTDIPSLSGYATKTWVNNNYALKSDIPVLSGYLKENNLKTINGESIVGSGDLSTHQPIEIGIDLDSEEAMGTYDDYKALVNEYCEDSGYTKKLMIYLESATKGLSCGSYPSYIDFNTGEIGGYFLDERDENNKRLVYYRIKGNEATQKVEVSFTPVSSGGDMPDLTGYATETWVESKGYLTEHQSLADYALKSEIPDVSGYALKSEVPSLTGYATETWVESKGYLTEHQSLADYALKSEIPSLDGYALKSEIPSLDGYALKSEIPSLDGYALKSEIPSLDGYVQETNLKTINGESIVGSGDITIQATGGVTEEWINSKGYATETWVSNQGYLTEHQSLAGYALKSEIPSLTGYATESWVTNQGYTTQTYVDNKIGQIDTLLDQMLG